MTFTVLPPEMSLRGYKPPIIGFDCLRCRKGVLECDVAGIGKRFGQNITVGQLAQEVAAISTRAPCGLAGSGQCHARAVEPPVHHWANLDDALKGGWHARLHCRRHVAALKRTDPCPEIFDLDVETLVVALGYDFKLQRLPSRCKCPKCHSEAVDIEWIVRRPTPPPFAPPAERVLAFKPTKAEVARLTFRVIERGESGAKKG